MGKGFLGALLTLALLGSAPLVQAADKDELVAVEKVMSMRVDGELVFDTEGRVIEQKVTTKLPDNLRQMAEKAQQSFRFKPVEVDGKPVIARTYTRLTLIAREQDEGNYEVFMEDARFFDKPSQKEDPKSKSGDYTPDDVVISPKTRVNPQYPKGLMRLGVGGGVAVRLLINPDGTVRNASVHQSALFNVKGRDKNLLLGLKLLEDSSLQALRKWTFNVPRRPDGSVDSKWLDGLIAVNYFMDGDDPVPAAGTWRIEQRTVRPKIEGGKYANASISSMDGSEGFVPSKSRIQLAESVN